MAITHLLMLPTELRLLIYDYLFEDSHTFTIASAGVEGADKRVSLTGVVGLPPHHVPVVRHYYDATLLSISNPITLRQKPGQEQIIPKIPFCGPFALLRTHRLLYDELSDYIQRRQWDNTEAGLSIYVTYPYGLLVLRSLYPQLVRQARNVYIAGCHVPFGSANLAYYVPRKSSLPVRHRCHGQAMRNQSLSCALPFSRDAANKACDALGAMVRTLLPPVIVPGFRKLEMRIFYSGDSYRAIWSEEQSPLSPTTGNMCGGNISMQVFRGYFGNAVHLVARPAPRRRTITTNWMQLGRTAEEHVEFVIGSAWPGTGKLDRESGPS